MSILAILGHLWPGFGLLRPRYQFRKLSLSLFDLVQIESREISEKIQNNNGLIMKMPILAMLSHFWPVFGLLWPLYQSAKLSMNKIDLILTEMSEKSEKIQNNNDPVNENADFGYFRPIFGLFLAGYDPCISVLSSQWVYLT